MIPDFLYRVGILARPNLLLGLAISGAALMFVILFKRNKPPNYFSLWLHHHFLHPKEWRAPQNEAPPFPVADETT